MKRLCVVLLLAVTFVVPARGERPNLLIITVDDMSADSLGIFGCPLPGTSPHIDRLAKQGMRFEHAHVVVGNCMPSRNVMWSGLYPHNNGVEGFYQVPDAKHPHLVDLMKEAGYFTGIFHKVSHSTPWHPYPWDVNLDKAPDGTKRHVKKAADYGSATVQGIAEAKQAGKPFCLMLNVADPHKPFYAEGRGGVTVPDENVPSRVFRPEEVPIPGFLFDDPVVRKELSHYYSSVRRADDCVGEILAALDDAGNREDTVILFLSDHGMPLPFAKTQLYFHSTNTPLFVIWPGVTSPDTIDEQHMVSAVDFLPTLLDIAGIEHPERLDGRSFAPILRGGAQQNRDYVIKEYNENAGASRDPMRGVETKDYLYLFNPWSDGERVMATATTGTSTYKRMAELAKSDTLLAARHELYQHRVPEELYLISEDPDCLVNLAGSVSHAEELSQLRNILERWMVETEDPMLEVFQRRDDTPFVAAWMAEQESVALERRKLRQKPNASGNQQNRNKNRRQSLIRFALPASITASDTVTVKVTHDLPKRLNTQRLTVTLKDGISGSRLSREIVTVDGKGAAEITFQLSELLSSPTVRVAAFVGVDFDSNLQYIQSAKVPVDRGR